jgi:hypothetical protein
MANKWIEFVKKYSLDHNMKYSECLKDVKCKAEYQKVKVVGKGYKEVVDLVSEQSKPVIKSLLKKGVNSTSEYLNKKIDGAGKKRVVGKGLFGDVLGTVGGLSGAYLTAGNPIAGTVGSFAGSKIGNSLDSVFGSGKVKRDNNVAYITGGSLYPG